MVGASVLASRAALYLGAGRVFTVSVADALPAYDSPTPELMFRAFADVPNLLALNPVVVCGCGMGQSAHAHQALATVLQHPTPVILDADALNIIASDPEHWRHRLQQRTGLTLVTPHPGEAARLLACSVAAIQANRLDSAQAISQRFQVIAVLKGHETWIAHGEQAWKNSTGNAGLASGGTGDVLAGMMGALLAQGLPPFEAARTAVFVHGRAAEQLAEKQTGIIGMTASEVLLEARHVLNQLGQH